MINKYFKCYHGALKLISAFLMFFCNLAIADVDEIYPENCKPFVIKDDVLRLNVNPPAIVMLHNLSKNDVWLTHDASTGGLNAGWSSLLSANKWSALAMTKVMFNLSCIESIPGHEQNIACSEALAACVWSPVKMPENYKGIFWAGENRSLNTLIAYIDRRGFSRELK